MPDGHVVVLIKTVIVAPVVNLAPEAPTTLHQLELKQEGIIVVGHDDVHKDVPGQRERRSKQKKQEKKSQAKKFIPEAFLEVKFETVGAPGRQQQVKQVHVKWQDYDETSTSLDRS